jgi:hypothetical protein
MRFEPSDRASQNCKNTHRRSTATFILPQPGRDSVAAERKNTFRKANASAKVPSHKFFKQIVNYSEHRIAISG